MRLPKLPIGLELFMGVKFKLKGGGIANNNRDRAIGRIGDPI